MSKIILFENFYSKSNDFLTKIEDELMDFIDEGILSIINDHGEYELTLTLKRLSDNSFDEYSNDLDNRNKTILKINNKIKKLSEEFNLIETCFMFTNGVNGTIVKENDELYVSLRKKD
jgi:uncharacterized ubiquitin-like protein YukD